MTNSTSIRQSRTELVDDTSLTGRTLALRLAELADGWFASLGHHLPRGCAIAATGGFGGHILCPGSDIDVVLLHPADMNDSRVQHTAQALWYPFWDAGIKLSPSAHSLDSLLALTAGDLAAATSALRMRCLAGNPALVHTAQAAAIAQWRQAGDAAIARLRMSSEERWVLRGDVASLLEPDIKEGRGGLRDFDSIRWALTMKRDDITAALEVPMDHLAGAADVLLAARCELHRATGRTSNVLLLDEQDRVAAALGYPDADDLMLHVASAARSLEWAGARFWRRLAPLGRTGRRLPSATLANPIAGVSVVDNEVQVGDDAEFEDPALVFRVAASAAHAGVPLSAGALQVLEARAAVPGAQWSARTRRHFLSLLGSGEALVGAVESLEQYNLFSRYLPEWRHVRSRPQRNAFHVYTVDRHLLRTVVNANELVRNVARPDLLLVGALLHDIGKGYAGDHTERGVELMGEMCARMGFDVADVATLVALVQHHLLLPETATRRDLSDPRTAANVAAAVGSASTLELLYALTEADSKATGPSAWSSWKASLLDQLAFSVAQVLDGVRPTESHTRDEEFRALTDLVRLDGGVHIEHHAMGDIEALRIASRDQQGLFAMIAGTLALHGLDVVGADAYTSADGVAVDQFQVVRNRRGSPNWHRFTGDLTAAIAGSLDLGSRLEQRMRTYSRSQRRVAAAPPRLEVLISNDASDQSTMIDVRAPDGLAVLYRLSHALADARLDIRSAKVATLGHEVVDVFYVLTAHTSQLDVEAHEALRSLLVASLST